MFGNGRVTRKGRRRPQRSHKSAIIVRQTRWVSAIAAGPRVPFANDMPGAVENGPGATGRRPPELTVSVSVWMTKMPRPLDR